MVSLQTVMVPITQNFGWHFHVPGPCVCQKVLKKLIYPPRVFKLCVTYMQHGHISYAWHSYISPFAHVLMCPFVLCSCARQPLKAGHAFSTLFTCTDFLGTANVFRSLNNHLKWVSLCVSKAFSLAPGNFIGVESLFALLLPLWGPGPWTRFFHNILRSICPDATPMHTRSFNQWPFSLLVSSEPEDLTIEFLQPSGTRINPTTAFNATVETFTDIYLSLFPTTKNWELALPQFRFFSLFDPLGRGPIATATATMHTLFP